MKFSSSRALCTKWMSQSASVSSSQRAIAIIGVIPQPDESRTRWRGSGPGGSANSPAGASAGSAMPGCRWSSSQLETRPPATRRTVIETVSGAVGLDEIE